jgi:hypothetical protein
MVLHAAFHRGVSAAEVAEAKAAATHRDITAAAAAAVAADVKRMPDCDHDAPAVLKSVGPCPGTPPRLDDAVEFPMLSLGKVRLGRAFDMHHGGTSGRGV